MRNSVLLVAQPPMILFVKVGAVVKVSCGDCPLVRAIPRPICPVPAMTSKVPPLAAVCVRDAPFKLMLPPSPAWAAKLTVLVPPASVRAPSVAAVSPSVRGVRDSVPPVRVTAEVPSRAATCESPLLTSDTVA